MIDHTGVSVSDGRVRGDSTSSGWRPSATPFWPRFPRVHGRRDGHRYGLAPKPDFWVNEGQPQKPMCTWPSARNPAPCERVLPGGAGRGRKGQWAAGLRVHYHKDYYGAFVLDPTATTAKRAVTRPGEPSAAHAAGAVAPAGGVWPSVRIAMLRRCAPRRWSSGQRRVPRPCTTGSATSGSTPGGR
jgi:hypothetical protein